jgi:6-phosphofructokinase 1
LYGIIDGYRGLIEGNWRLMDAANFSDILRQGGTVLGSSRQPFKEMQVVNADGTYKLSMMLNNYHKGKFDALVILGGNGTHKTAHLLSQNGINIVTLPKTIDNDVYGTDLSFGFDSAVDKATSVIDAIHTTAASHGRVFVVELMGNKVGWITLCAGIAGGADVILIPEIPYCIENVIEVIQRQKQTGKNYSVIAVAEGTLAKKEAALTKNERKMLSGTTGNRLVKILSERLEQDVRAVIPGHFQRGGEPTAADRLLCSRFGAKAGELVYRRQFGYMTALRGTEIVPVPLAEVAGKKRCIPFDSDILLQATLLGISLGNSYHSFDQSSLCAI